MSLLSPLQNRAMAILRSGSTDQRRPKIGKGNVSNIPGVHIIGDLAGAPVIKLAMAQGVEVIDYLSTLPEMKQPKADPNVLDVLIVGAGAAGLNAALAAKEKGFSFVVLEKNKIANTIENFPEGKWVYAEPDDRPAKGKLWLDGATKEELVARWHQIIGDNQLDVRSEEGLKAIDKQSGGLFRITSDKQEYVCRKVVLATGQRGNPRKLGVPGEDELEPVYHRLYSPRKYNGEEILVVGGGNSAVEAALVLSEQNKVRLSYRKQEFGRLFKDNRRQLDEAVAQGRIELVLGSNVTEFRPGEAVLQLENGESQTVRAEHSFVLIGAEVPTKFLKSIGIRLENEWDGIPWRAALLTFLTFLGLWFFGGQASLFGFSFSASAFTWVGGAISLASLAGLLTAGFRGDRFAWLGVSFFVWYSIYGIKRWSGAEFWPYTGWGYDALTLFQRPWSFWYTVLYTTLMTVFGILAMKRWGIDKRDRFQVWRFISLISFQWIFFFLVPEFFFQWAVKYQWVGESLANDPSFADNAWRSYGLIYAWPLFFYTFLDNPHQIWVVWGVLLTFGVIPILVLFHGKRYCSWICGCGGLAETFGDRWRHLAPKGKVSVKLEWMAQVVLIFAFIITLFLLTRDTIHLLQQPAEWGKWLYQVLVDVWLVGILPVTLYPFLGGKVWCRYWCPLAKLMGLMSKFYSKVGISKFKIVANDKCIACNECSRNCQVGIPVMEYALKQEVLDNATSSCIGCGICVTACPMDTLSFGEKRFEGEQRLPVASTEAH